MSKLESDITLFATQRDYYDNNNVYFYSFYIFYNLKQIKSNVNNT